MPRGSRHQLDGLLLRQGGGFILQMDDGGVWRLEAPNRARRLVGRRVQVEGVRAGFDLLSVTKVDVVGAVAELREPVFGHRGLARALLALAGLTVLLVVIAG